LRKPRGIFTLEKKEHRFKSGLRQVHKSCRTNVWGRGDQKAPRAEGPKAEKNYPQCNCDCKLLGVTSKRRRLTGGVGARNQKKGQTTKGPSLPSKYRK